MTTAQTTAEPAHGDLATAWQRGHAVARWDEFYFDAARSARDRAHAARHIGNEARARTAFSDAYRYLRWARGLGYVR